MCSQNVVTPPDLVFIPAGQGVFHDCFGESSVPFSHPPHLLSGELSQTLTLSLSRRLPHFL